MGEYSAIARANMAMAVGPFLDIDGPRFRNKPQWEVVRAGIYFLPFSDQDHAPDQVAMFASVLPNGMHINIRKMMLIGFSTQFISTL